MTENQFMQETGIPVSVNLVTGGVVEATLAGKGPDAALFLGGEFPVNLAARDLLVDLSQFDDFEEVKGRFQKNANNPNASQRPNRHPQNEYSQDINIEEHPEAPVLNVNAYACLPQDQIRKIGVEKGLDENRVLDMKNQEILAEILKKHSAAGGVITGSGTLEVLPDGFGFLRSPNNSYLSGPEDIYVSPAQVKGLGLKTGDTVFGQVRTPRDGERFFAILRVLSVNGEDSIKARVRAPFESLTPLFPNERINLETAEEDVSLRIINMFSPIGKGQRLLITAPPRTGKTVLMQKIANAITQNNPECHLMVVLVDERPEEVTDMQRTVKGEVIHSTFDRPAEDHTTVAELAIERAKRLVEMGLDVVVLLDLSTPTRCTSPNASSAPPATSRREGPSPSSPPA